MSAMGINLNAQAMYQRARDRVGVPVTLQRVNGDAPNTRIVSAQVIAVIQTDAPSTPTGAFAGPDAVTEDTRRIIVLASDLAAANYPLPIEKNDKVLVGADLMNVERADPWTRFIAGAIVVVVSGVN